MEEIKKDTSNDVEKLKNIREILESIDDQVLNNQLIVDNKILFYHNDNLYRCSMPSQKERTIAENTRNKKYMEMLREGVHPTKKQLINLLKEKQNIDIEKLEEEKRKITEELNSLYYDLANQVSSDITALKEYEGKILNKKRELINLSCEITNYLLPCIEDQLEAIYIKYITSVVTETLDDNPEETWIKVWKSYDEYENDITSLPNKALEHTVKLLINTR